jgi:DNA mismatch repair protein MutL
MTENGIIQLLPDAIANQIAAGEVIQRPASVVKELMENAIDAEAKSISLIVKDAGRTSIQVIDDGKGMSTTDARMCFERHATSKLRKIDDLFTLHTMGFRGEALASIAAVAQVEMKTKLANDAAATRIVIEGSHLITQETCSHTVGTSLTVKNLFYNVPARRNFLKSNQVETKHILDEFIHIALANPDIAFSLFHNGVEIYNLKSGNLRQRIVGLFGKNYNEMLVPIAEETDYITVQGFIGKPEIAKKTRGEQFFFVNKRFIKSVFLNNAITKTYEGLVADKTYPFYCLFIDIHPKHIDVNVHPTKQEIKFDDERSVYMMLHAAGKRGLAKYSVTPMLDFEQEASFTEMRSFNQKFSTDVLPGGFSGGHGIGVPRQYQNNTQRDWQDMFSFNKEENERIITLPSKSNTEDESPLNIYSRASEKDKTTIAPIQINNTYILTQIKSALLLVNQQKAHERILFEQYLSAFDNPRSAIQKKLFPKTIELSSTDSVLLGGILEDMRLLGFDIENFGSNTYVIHAMPEDIREEYLEDVIHSLLEQEKDAQKLSLKDYRVKLSKTIAKKSALRIGTEMSSSAIAHLIDSLFACEMPAIGVDGTPTFIALTFDDIESQFR